MNLRVLFFDRPLPLKTTTTTTMTKEMMQGGGVGDRAKIILLIWRTLHRLAITKRLRRW
jgi:hypothetical protein